MSFTRHGELTDQLADTIRELGMVRATITTTRADAWNAHAYLPVTERKETTSASIAQLVAEAANLEADVDALRVELAHVTLTITHTPQRTS